jgi:TPR repeat protein
MYAQGEHGAPKDPVQSLQWFEKAAAAGHVESTCNAAACYETGTGTAVNLERAEQLYRRGIALGSARAAYSLARLMEVSQKVLERAEEVEDEDDEDGDEKAQKPDPRLARRRECLQLYRSAAQAGYAPASQALERIRNQPSDGSRSSRSDPLLRALLADLRRTVRVCYFSGHVFLLYLTTCLVLCASADRPQTVAQKHRQKQRQAATSSFG